MNPITRALTERERTWCARAMEYCSITDHDVRQRAVDEALLHMQRPSLWSIRGPKTLIAHATLYKRASGITLGRHVYIKRSIASETGALPLSLVVHEVVHVAQYLEQGYAGFLARYLADYAKNLKSGMPDYEAYLNIPHELEARRAERYIERYA